MNLKNKYFYKFNYKKTIISLLVFSILICLAINPKLYSKITLNGIEIWAKLLLPTLFPYFFFTKLVSHLELNNIIDNIFSVFTKILKLPKCSGYILFMSIISGYPLGAKMVSDLYKSDKISQSEAKKIVCSTSNSGPMFIVGTVGVGMLFSNTCGLIIFFSHIIGSILNGLLYKNLKTENGKNKNSYHMNSSNILSETMLDSITSILLVGGYVAVCFVIIEILNSVNILSPIILFISKVFNCDLTYVSSFINGLFEMTNGCLNISQTTMSLFAKTVTCATLISFGGFSTILQSMAFLKKTGIKYSFFIKQKITHAIFTIIASVILGLIFIH